MPTTCIIDLEPQAWHELDLLRQRREALGLDTPKPVPAQQLLRKGGLIGASCVLVVAAAWGGVMLLLAGVQRRIDELQPAAAEHATLTQRLQTERTNEAQLKKSNQALADGIAGVKSGSALLVALAQITPPSIQLSKVAQQSTTALSLKGVAAQPLGLRSVNAMQLELENTPFFQPRGAKLIKASVEQVPATQPNAQPSQRLNFELTAAFAADAAKEMRPLLLKLGAVGLTRRHQLLRQEGLLP
jgi:Tfp pilus assembly protein PilN